MQQIVLYLISSHKFDLKPNSLNLPRLQEESHVGSIRGMVTCEPLTNLRLACFIYSFVDIRRTI